MSWGFRVRFGPPNRFVGLRGRGVVLEANGVLCTLNAVLGPMVKPVYGHLLRTFILFHMV